MKKITFTLIIFLIVMLPLQKIMAQLTQPNGPYGGAIFALAVNGNDIFAGTSNGGVWRRPLSEVFTFVKGQNRLIPDNYVLEQNYPNPFNPSTTIRFSLPQRAMVRLSVFNSLGCRVAELLNSIQEAGTHEIRFNAFGIASGVYYYSLEAGDFRETKKLVLLR